MVSRASLLVAFVGVFLSQHVNANQLTLPYDSSIYRQMLSGAPWFCYCDLPWLSFYDSWCYEQFSQIAQQYDIRISDVYQYHTIIEQSMPNLPYSQESQILQTTAAELRKELNRRGIPYLPTPPSCTLTDSKYDQQYPVLQTNSMPVIAKRSPQVLPDNYPLPNTYPHSADVDYSSSYDYSLAYKNLYVMLDQCMPDLPRSVYENIKNSILENIPPQYQYLADDVANQLTTNIRYTVGMAQRRMPPFYY